MKKPKLPKTISIKNPLQAAASWAEKLSGGAPADEPTAAAYPTRETERPAGMQSYWVDYPPKKAAPPPPPAPAPRRQDDWSNYFSQQDELSPPHSAAPSRQSSHWDEYFADAPSAHAAPREAASRKDDWSSYFADTEKMAVSPQEDTWEDYSSGPRGRPGDYFIYGTTGAAPQEPEPPVSPRRMDAQPISIPAASREPSYAPPQEDTFSPLPAEEDFSPLADEEPEDVFSAPGYEEAVPPPRREKKKSRVEDIRYALWSVCIVVGLLGTVAAFFLAAVF